MKQGPFSRAGRQLPLFCAFSRENRPRKGRNLNREDRLLAYLKGACPGRAYRVSGRELAHTLGISVAELQKQVNRLRRRGIPIASDRSGYFYAQTAGEVYATIRNLKKMRAGLDAAIQGLEQALDNFPAGR